MCDSELPGPVARFWTEFLSQTGRPADTPLYDSFHFDDNERDSNVLAELVLSGTKGATASLQWEYEGDGNRAPAPGDLSIVTNWAGSPLCVIETTVVDVQPFDEVSEDFAAAEGEGDGSLRHWRAAHEPYFRRVCERLGREPSADMEVVCERFRVLFPRR
ncbi:MAG: ASCH domain-containing protein [Acidimicrobiales bacterium]